MKFPARCRTTTPQQHFYRMEDWKELSLRITKDLFSRRRENRDEISWISKELLRPFSIILLKENLGSSSTGRKFSCFANFALWKKETKDED